MNMINYNYNAVIGSDNKKSSFAIGVLRQRDTQSSYRTCDKRDKYSISCTYDTDNGNNLVDCKTHECLLMEDLTDSIKNDKDFPLTVQSITMLHDDWILMETVLTL